MPKMCELLAPGPRAESVYVNPITVRYVRPGSPGTSLIHFDNNQSLGVAMPVQELIRLLDIAMNIDHA
jgi:hypothetical protein